MQRTISTQATKNEENNQPELEPVKKPKTWLWIVLAVVMTVLLVSWVVWTYQKAVFEAERLALEQKVLELEKQVQQDETADWQTYRNEQYGFEFRYPDTWGSVKMGSRHDYDRKLERGVTFYFDKLDYTGMKVSLEDKGFKISNPWLPSITDGLPIAFGKIDDLDNYCNITQNEINQSILNCKKVKLGNKKSIQTDQVLCVGSPTGGEIGCEFYRILLVNTGFENYPTLIININLGRYYYDEFCSTFKEDCFLGANGQYRKVLELNKERIETFNQILSTFRFLDGEENCKFKKACNIRDDCKYIDYADDCYNLVYFRECTGQQIEEDLLPYRAGFICGCENSQCVKVRPQEEEDRIKIIEEIEKANYCTKDEDCVYELFSKGCIGYFLINRKEQNRLHDLEAVFVEKHNIPPCFFEAQPYKKIGCRNNICVEIN